MTSFPSSLKTKYTASGTDTLATGSHATVHNNIEDELIAVQTKVGINSSATTSSHDYKLSGVADGDKAASKTGTETLTNKTLTSPVINTPTGDVVTLNGTQTLTSKTLTTPKINENVSLTATSTELNTLDGSGPRKTLFICGSNGTNFTAGTTQYVSVAGYYANAYAMPIPIAGTFKNLKVYTGGAPGSSKSVVCTLVSNNVDTALTCTITGALVNEADDLTHTVTVAAGVRVALKIVTTAGATASDIIWAVEFDAA